MRQSSCEDIRDRHIMRALLTQHCIAKCSRNPHFIGTSSMLQIFRCVMAASEIFSPRISLVIVKRKCPSGRPRHLHTKLSGVTVIFFLL
jgi:hypothetical protein